MESSFRSESFFLLCLKQQERVPAQVLNHPISLSPGYPVQPCSTAPHRTHQTALRALLLLTAWKLIGQLRVALRGSVLRSKWGCGLAFNSSKNRGLLHQRFMLRRSDQWIIGF